MNPRGRTLLQMATWPLLLSAIAGCAASRVVVPGDLAAVSFTCLQKSGELAASSYGDRDFPDLAKSPLFVKRSRNDAVVLEAKAASGAIEQKRRSFEDEILTGLSRSLTGLKEGDSVTVQLEAGRLAWLPREEQYVKIARVWKQAKEVRMSAARYRELTGKEPKEGDDYVVYNAVPGKLVTVSGEEVLIRFAPVVTEVKLPFGKGIVSDRGEHYDIEVLAEKGTLIRTGGLAGRISDVDADFVTIDYGNPLGGETLACDVKVESVVPAGKAGDRPLPVAEGKQAAAGKSGDSVDKASGIAKHEVTGLENPQDAKGGGAEGQPAAADTSAALPAASTAADGDNFSCHGETTGSAGCGEAAQAAGAPLPAETGDLAVVDFTATLPDGMLIATTLPEVAGDPSLKKVAGFSEQGDYRPQEVAVGRSDLFPGLGEALAGMKAGEQKEVHLSPEQAFGPRDPKKEARLPLTRTFPKEFRMGAQEYVQRFGGFPAVGKDVELLPFLKSTVTAVTDHDVALVFQAEDGKTITENYGTLTMSVKGDQITTTLTPKLGAAFPLSQGQGTIVAADSDGFTVDGNSPLAGKELLLKVTLRSISKGESGAAKALDWVDSYDRALAEAKEQGKPTFLILYADWCGWCKKTFTEVLPDPRLTKLKEKFVWARVNSDKESKYKELYHQDGFPLMLVLNPDGSVKKRLDGYRDARKLSGELAGVLQKIPSNPPL